MTRQLAAAFVVLACVTPAAAQSTGSDRPTRGLFGSRAPESTPQGLDVSASVLQAYDDNLLAEVGSIAPGAATLSGYYTQAQADILYRWSNRVINLGVNSASAWRYYSHQGEARNLSHSGAIGLTATMSRRATLTFNQTAAYSPSYFAGLFPGLGTTDLGTATPIAPDYAASDASSYSYSSAATLRHGLTRRGAISVGAERNSTDFRGQATSFTDTNSLSARGEYSQAIGRHSALRTGYRYHTGEFGRAAVASGTTTEHAVDVGFDVTRIVSASRRAQFSFGIGLSVTDSAPIDVVSVDAVAGRGDYSQVVGNVAVTYDLARTWQSRLAYRRGLEFIPQLSEPVFVSGFSGGLSGLVSRRLKLEFGIGYATGESAVYTGRPAFDTYTGTVRSNIALTRWLALSAEYVYYLYDFSGSGLLEHGLPPRLERNGVRAGFSVSMPVF